jgi:hypothetical protein
MMSPEEKRQDQTLSGFRDWTVGKCYQFMDRWNALEQFHAEQAACSIACEEFGLDYMVAEWVGVAEVVAKLEGKLDGTVKD